MSTKEFGRLLDQEAPKEFGRVIEDTREPPKKGKFTLFSDEPLKYGARQLAARVTGLPGDVLEFLSKVAPQMAQQQAEEKGEEIPPLQQNITKGMEFIGKLPIPTSEQTKKFIHEKSPGLKELPLEPKTPGGKAGATVGDWLGYAVPGGFPKLVSRLAFGALAGTGAAAGEAAGLGETGQLLTGLTIPTLFDLVKLIKTGQFNPQGKIRQALYEWGLKKGLSAEELTPLLQSPRKKNILTKFARRTGRSQKILEKSEEALSNVYEGVKKESRNLPDIQIEGQIGLIDDFSKLLFDLEQTIKASPDKELAIKFIRESVENMNNKGFNLEQLINFYQDLNSFNWSKIKGGKQYLEKFKEPILKLIEKESPELAENFRNTNKLWSNLKNMQEKLGYSKEVESLLSGSEALGFLYNIFTGNFEAAGAVIAAEGARRLSTELLLNPHFANIGNNFVKAVQKGNKKAALVAYTQMKEKVKEEDPDLYKEIDWKKLEP